MADASPFPRIRQRSTLSASAWASVAKSGQPLDDPLRVEREPRGEGGRLARPARDEARAAKRREERQQARIDTHEIVAVHEMHHGGSSFALNIAGEVEQLLRDGH